MATKRTKEILRRLDEVYTTEYKCYLEHDSAWQLLIATILSAAMMLRYTFDLDKEADAIEAAVKQVLKDGYRTIDIMPQEEDKRNAVTQVGTAQMGDLICERI